MPNRTTRAATAAVTVLAAVATTQTIASVSTPANAAYRFSSPRALSVAYTTTTTTKLTWRKTGTATYYRVMRSRSKTMSHATFTRVHARYLVVRHLATGTRYYYKVRAIRSTGSALSGYSPPVSAVTKKPAPAPSGSSTTPTSTPTPSPTPSPTSSPSPTASPSPTGTPTPTDSPTPTTSPSPTVTPGPANIRVASYNITTVTVDQASGDRKIWKDRRQAVVDNIWAQHPDVFGLQEASNLISMKSRLVAGDTQFDDVKLGLNSLGGHYAVTNEYGTNCVDSRYQTNCVYQYRGASADNRILYNTDVLSMVSQGAYEYQQQASSTSTRNLAYAVFEVKATGSRFLFTDTHLEPSDRTIREEQWHEAINKVTELKNNLGLPVISVGDYNIQKHDDMACDMLPLQQSSGVGDILSQKCNFNATSGWRAQHLIDANINSNNKWVRDITQWSTYYNKPGLIGNNIDWIFASNNLAVPEYQLVCNFNHSTMQMSGTIPSDHNMVRATITIP